MSSGEGGFRPPSSRTSYTFIPQVTVLVMCHTRELAFQISKEYERFSKYMPSVKVSLRQAGRVPRGLLRPRWPQLWASQHLPSLATAAAFEVCGGLCAFKSLMNYSWPLGACAHPSLGLPFTGIGPSGLCPWVLRHQG